MWSCSVLCPGAFGRLLAARRARPKDLALRAAAAATTRPPASSGWRPGNPRRALRAFLRARAWAEAAEAARALGNLRQAADAVRRRPAATPWPAAAQSRRAAATRPRAQQLWPRYGTYLVETTGGQSWPSSRSCAPATRAAPPTPSSSPSRPSRLSAATVDVAIRAAADAGRAPARSPGRARHRTAPGGRRPAGRAPASRSRRHGPSRTPATRCVPPRRCRRRASPSRRPACGRSATSRPGTWPGGRAFETAGHDRRGRRGAGQPRAAATRHSSATSRPG